MVKIKVSVKLLGWIICIATVHMLLCFACYFVSSSFDEFTGDQSFTSQIAGIFGNVFSFPGAVIQDVLNLNDFLEWVIFGMNSCIWAFAIIIFFFYFLKITGPPGSNVVAGSERKTQKP